MGDTTAINFFDQQQIQILSVRQTIEAFLKGNGMKKVAIVVSIIILIYLAFKWIPIQDYADRFIESNEAHERKQIQTFLSQ